MPGTVPNPGPKNHGFFGPRGFQEAQGRMSTRCLCRMARLWHVMKLVPLPVFGPWRRMRSRFRYLPTAVRSLTLQRIRRVRRLQLSRRTVRMRAVHSSANCCLANASEMPGKCRSQSAESSIIHVGVGMAASRSCVVSSGAGRGGSSASMTRLQQPIQYRARSLRPRTERRAGTP